MRSVMNVALAEDITAETFLKALKGLPRFKGTTKNIKNWIYRIASNCMMDHYRRSGREIAVEEMGISYQELAARDLIVEADARSQLEQFERYQRLHRAIRRLKPVYQVAVMLHYFEEKSYEEIAEIMKCRLATVRWRLHQARRQLARLIGNLEGDAE